jgi:hypothetical protein
MASARLHSLIALAVALLTLTPTTAAAAAASAGAAARGTCGYTQWALADAAMEEGFWFGLAFISLATPRHRTKRAISLLKKHGCKLR